MVIALYFLEESSAGLKYLICFIHVYEIETIELKVNLGPKKQILM